VLSSSEGFKIMVNEHNRISIPMIFLTETQLNEEDKTWMHGVRIREDYFKIDLLEGKKPNMGWLGPEMSGEEGATFPEKLWWAIDEAKARLDTTDIGKQYDKELLMIDEKDNIQLLLFGMLAKEEADVLAGHIWVTKEELEVQNMKYLCPVVLQALVSEMTNKVGEYQAVANKEAEDMDAMRKIRADKERLKAEIEKIFETQTPLKWVNRVIMWCAEGMPCFASAFVDDELKKGSDAKTVVQLAIANNAEVTSISGRRSGLIKKYMGS